RLAARPAGLPAAQRRAPGYLPHKGARAAHRWAAHRGGGTSGMRTADLLRGLVAQLADTTLRYLAAHAFKTAEDYGAGVGIRDGAPLADVPAVPKAYGLPGASSRIKRGQPVLIVFRGGDPGAPVVAGYPEGCKADEMGLDADTVIRLGGAGAVVLAKGG